jgi:hypothetical protein
MFFPGKWPYPSGRHAFFWMLNIPQTLAAQVQSIVIHPAGFACKFMEDGIKVPWG